MNRAAFFQHLTETDPRLFPNGMTAAQRAGLSVKLDVWARWYAADHPLTFLAAALGQIFRETGGGWSRCSRPLRRIGRPRLSGFRRLLTRDG
ncbi:hypothetical protein [Hoeflea alexandrii]